MRKLDNKTGITRDRGQFRLVKTLLRIRIRIDGSKNHRRPHVHVDYGGNYHVASYAIDSGERLAGGLNGKYDKLTRNWISRHRAKLLKAWKKIQASENADAIVAELRRAH